MKKNLTEKEIILNALGVDLFALHVVEMIDDVTDKIDEIYKQEAPTIEDLRKDLRTLACLKERKRTLEEVRRSYNDYRK